MDRRQTATTEGHFWSHRGSIEVEQLLAAWEQRFRAGAGTRPQALGVL